MYEDIIRDPKFRRFVQENGITRRFMGPLTPRLLYGAEFQEQSWGANEGISKIETKKGLMEPDAGPTNGEPDTEDFPAEQWVARLYPHAKSIEVDLPQSTQAAVNFFSEKMESLGTHAGMSLNRVYRNAIYRAGLSGHTYLTAVATATATLAVKSLNGFTTARNPDLVGGEPVQYAPVSSANPLYCTLFDGTNEITVQVIGYTPTVSAADDPFTAGPGTVTLSAVTTAPNGAYLVANDASKVVRPGGGKSTEALTGNSRFRYAHMRDAMAHMSNNSIPVHPDGFYHWQMNATSQNQLYEDTEMQRLNTSLPEYLHYKNFALGILFGGIIYNNEESPNFQRVLGAGTFTRKDAFPGATRNTSSVYVERPVVTGYGGFLNYYQDKALHVSDVGAPGRVRRFAEFTSDNGVRISLNPDHVVVIVRPPLDALQSKVKMSWAAMMGPLTRPDGAVNLGSNCRYKRHVVIEHGV